MIQCRICEILLPKAKDFLNTSRCIQNLLETKASKLPPKYMASLEETLAENTSTSIVDKVIENISLEKLFKQALEKYKLVIDNAPLDAGIKATFECLYTYITTNETKFPEKFQELIAMLKKPSETIFIKKEAIMYIGASKHRVEKYQSSKEYLVFFQNFFGIEIQLESKTPIGTSEAYLYNLSIQDHFGYTFGTYFLEKELHGQLSLKDFLKIIHMKGNVRKIVVDLLYPPRDTSILITPTYKVLPKYIGIVAIIYIEKTTNET